MRGPYFSRKPHVPSNSSGVTIGRGYDIKNKTRSKIIGDLTAAGIDRALAEKFAGAEGLQRRDYMGMVLDNISVLRGWIRWRSPLHSKRLCSTSLTTNTLPT